MNRKTGSSAMYTAKEIREVSNRLFIEEPQTMLITDAADILSRVADAMEIEEEREKKYEYKVLYRRCDGRMCDSIGHAQDIKRAMESLRVYSGYKDAHIVRREVGEWERVKDELQDS